jgi:hypothetical protein
MNTYTIIAHTKNADYVHEIDAAYHIDAMKAAKDATLAAGFLHGEFTIEFLTNAEAAEYYAACKAEAA